MSYFVSSYTSFGTDGWSVIYLVRRQHLSGDRSQPDMVAVRLVNPHPLGFLDGTSWCPTTVFEIGLTFDPMADCTAIRLHVTNHLLIQ
jgi:hypothetical protein